MQICNKRQSGLSLNRRSHTHLQCHGASSHAPCSTFQAVAVAIANLLCPRCSGQERAMAASLSGSSQDEVSSARARLNHPALNPLSGAEVLRECLIQCRDVACIQARRCNGVTPKPPPSAALEHSGFLIRPEDSYHKRRSAAAIQPADLSSSQWWSKPLLKSVEEELKEAHFPPWRYASLCSGTEAPLHALKAVGAIWSAVGMQDFPVMSSLSQSPSPFMLLGYCGHTLTFSVSFLCSGFGDSCGSFVLRRSEGHCSAVLQEQPPVQAPLSKCGWRPERTMSDSHRLRLQSQGHGSCRETRHYDRWISLLTFQQDENNMPWQKEEAPLCCLKVLSVEAASSLLSSGKLTLLTWALGGSTSCPHMASNGYTRPLGWLHFSRGWSHFCTLEVKRLACGWLHFSPWRGYSYPVDGYTFGLHQRRTLKPQKPNCVTLRIVGLCCRS